MQVQYSVLYYATIIRSTVHVYFEGIYISSNTCRSRSPGDSNYQAIPVLSTPHKVIIGETMGAAKRSLAGHETLFACFLESQVRGLVSSEVRCGRLPGACGSISCRVWESIHPTSSPTWKSRRKIMYLQYSEAFLLNKRKKLHSAEVLRESLRDKKGEKLRHVFITTTATLQQDLQGLQDRSIFLPSLGTGDLSIYLSNSIQHERQSKLRVVHHPFFPYSEAEDSKATRRHSRQVTPTSLAFPSHQCGSSVL